MFLSNVSNWEFECKKNILVKVYVFYNWVRKLQALYDAKVFFFNSF